MWGEMNAFAKSGGVNGGIVAPVIPEHAFGTGRLTPVFGGFGGTNFDDFGGGGDFGGGFGGDYGGGYRGRGQGGYGGGGGYQMGYEGYRR